MSKEILLKVLTKELGLGLGLASDIADECTPSQLEAVTEYLQAVSRSPHKQRIDNFDKYAVMMMTAFKTAAMGGQAKPVERGRYSVKAPVGVSPAVKQASMDRIREFLNA